MNKKINTTFEDREIIMAHNDLFIRTFFRSGLSISFPISKSLPWDGNYEMKMAMKEVDGI